MRSFIAKATAKTISFHLMVQFMYTNLEKTLQRNLGNQVRFFMEDYAADFWQYLGMAVKIFILEGRP